MTGSQDELLVERGVEAYLDGSLDGDGAIALTRALRTGGDEAARVRELLSFAGLLGQALDGAGAEAFARSVDERIDAQGKATAFVRAVDRSLPKRPRRRRQASWFQPLAVAAMVLLAIGAAWWFAPRKGATIPMLEVCRITQSADGSWIERAGVERAAQSGMPLVTGDVVMAAGDLKIRFADGSLITLDGGARVGVVSKSGTALGNHLELRLGTLTAGVVPQPAGRPFTISTDVASIEVVGTQFALTTLAGRTRLGVVHGEVRMTRAADVKSISVKGGEFAIVAEGEEFLAKPFLEPVQNAAAAPSPVPSPRSDPREQAWGPWRALFEDTGLAEWTQQHGTWTNDHGVITGVSENGKAARLLGTSDLLDLELTCRMRIANVDHAELQVGTYNWFFDIPAGAGDWVEVALRQRGDVLGCTAGGVDVPRQAGAGESARPGSLAFYVMPGGRIEISEAKIRMPLVDTP